MPGAPARGRPDGPAWLTLLSSLAPPRRGQACAGVAGVLRAVAALAVVGWAVVLALALDMVSQRRASLPALSSSSLTAR